MRENSGPSPCPQDALPGSLNFWTFAFLGFCDSALMEFSEIRVLRDSYSRLYEP